MHSQPVINQLGTIFKINRPPTHSERAKSSLPILARNLLLYSADGTTSCYQKVESHWNPPLQDFNTWRLQPAIERVTVSSPTHKPVNNASSSKETNDILYFELGFRHHLNLHYVTAEKIGHRLIDRINLKVHTLAEVLDLYILLREISIENVCS